MLLSMWFSRDSPWTPSCWILSRVPSTVLGFLAAFHTPWKMHGPHSAGIEQFLEKAEESWEANELQLSYRHFTSAMYESELSICPHGQTLDSSEYLRANERWQKRWHPLLLLWDLTSLYVSSSPCRYIVISGHRCTGSPWKDVCPLRLSQHIGCYGRACCLCSSSSVCTRVWWL